MTHTAMEGDAMRSGCRPLLQGMALAAALGALSAPAGAAGTPSPANAYLYIIWPPDGQHIRGAFWCRFGLRNMGVTRAGDVAPNLGHHHLLVDAEASPDPGAAIPADKTHIHFGAGQTEGRLDLPPGPHTLQLEFGDAEHKPFDPPVVSRKIHIVVE